MVGILMFLAQMNAYLGMSRPGELWVWSSPLLQDTLTRTRISTGDTLSSDFLDTTLSQAGTTRVVSIVQRVDAVDVQVEEVTPALLNPGSWERDTLLFTFLASSDTVLQDTFARRYVVPFNPGTSWRLYPFLPLNAPLPADFDGDGDVDTLTLLADTATVGGVETLATSIGTVQAFLVDRTTHYRMAYSADSGAPSWDSMEVVLVQTEWWVPDTGKVRDSVVSDYRLAKADTLTRIHRVFVRELLSTTPVMESPISTPSLSIRVAPGQVLFDLPEEQTLMVLDPAGRRVRQVRARRGHLFLTPGIYLLHLAELQKTVRVAVP